MRAQVYVSEGRWVADCPRPDCPNAERAGRDPDTGHVGGLDGAVLRCSHCRWVGQADWPPNVDDIDYLLGLRPVPATRNWRPPETVHDLLEENLRHGVFPVEPEALAGAPTGPLLAILGDHITVGRELMPAARTAIAGRQ